MAASLRELRRKIKTIQNIHQITRAMKMVATAKLQRVRQATESGQRFRDELQRLLNDVAAVVDSKHPYLQGRQINTVGVVIVGGDRGLCGAFNRQIRDRALAFIATQQVPVEVIVIGDRLLRYAQRRDLDVTDSFSAIEKPDDSRIGQIVERVREWYASGRVDLIQAVYARFESIVRHSIVSEQLLPLATEAQEMSEDQQMEYIWEPAAGEVLAALLPRVLEAEIAQILLGTQASAQAARMAAMAAATDNAEDMITDLTRELNRARQEEITAELLDVVGGAKALQS